MAAKNTVNIAKMQAAAGELENIHVSMQKEIKKLEETISEVRKVWSGEASTTYLKQYDKNAKSFSSMAKAIKDASEALKDSCSAYDNADSNAMDIVAKLGGRG